MEDEWKLKCVAHGYHIYKGVWQPYLWDEFTTKHQKNNPHDKYAIAVVPVDAKSKSIVGHLPKEIDIQGVLPIYSSWRYDYRS